MDKEELKKLLSSVIQEELKEVKQDLKEVKQDLKDLKQDLKDLKQDLKDLKREQNKMSAQLGEIAELTLRGVIVERLGAPFARKFQVGSLFGLSRLVTSKSSKHGERVAAEVECAKKLTSYIIENEFDLAALNWYRERLGYDRLLKVTHEMKLEQVVPKEAKVDVDDRVLVFRADLASYYGAYLKELGAKADSKINQQTVLQHRDARYRVLHQELGMTALSFSLPPAISFLDDLPARSLDMDCRGKLTSGDPTIVEFGEIKRSKLNGKGLTN